MIETTEPYTYNLLQNVHKNLPDPTETGKSYISSGNYKYFHYTCDGHNDIGWGCAYRTLQTLCSWILDVKGQATLPPTLPEIQHTLVRIGDKLPSFEGSRDWIGAIEVFFVIDTLYDVQCRIQHVPKCDQLKRYVDILKRHFADGGGPVMMGGDLDCASKGIFGVHIDGNEAYLLVVDPHFSGQPTDANELIERQYVTWRHANDFCDSSFYNLCLPLLKGRAMSDEDQLMS